MQWRFTIHKWLVCVGALCLFMAWLRPDRARVWGDTKGAYVGLTLRPAMWPANIQFSRQRFSSFSGTYYHYIAGFESP